MIKNPLFPNDNPPVHNGQGNNPYVPHSGEHTVQPLSDDQKISLGANPAADLIREKLQRLYAAEPDAFEEEREAEAARPRSKHQEYMHRLSTSGQSLADIQTQWHEYYVGLPDDEKHEVWREFYENNVPRDQPILSEPAPQKARGFVASQAQHATENRIVSADHMLPDPQTDKRSPGAIRTALREHIQTRTDRLSENTKQNIKSLTFGLSAGLVVLVIFLFSFFNQIIIAPFIQPGRTSAAPVIVSSSSVDTSSPSIIIPKINVQIPTVFDVPNNSEAAIQSGLENGVVHYPTTKNPGEKGNAAFFGHSSNNIFNKGHYKFAFVLLHKLQAGDTFYLTYNNSVYGYKVISTKIVPPSDVSVLNDIPGEAATATLITCDPPGTTLNRLIVVGRQVSPDPSGNTTATSVSTDASQPLPGNGPSLWSRLWDGIF